MTPTPQEPCAGAETLDVSWNVKIKMASFWQGAVAHAPIFVRERWPVEDHAFAVAVDQRTRDAMLSLGLVATLALHVIALPIEWLVATEAILAYLAPAHVIITLAVAGALFLRHRSLRLFRLAGVGVILTTIASYAWVLHLSVATEKMLLPESGAAHILIVAGLLVFMPYLGRWLAVTLITTFALTAAALGSTPGVASWLVVLGIATAVGLLIGQSVMRILLSGAMTNYRRLTKIAPPHLVRESTLSGRPFEELCAPTSRRCVCISLSWVDYEMLAAFLPPYVVEAELRLYYKFCTELLRGALRTDAFYLDATVDEVFVVAYETTNATLDQTWARALSFVELLFEARRRRRPPFAGASLAVGISRGEAWVGMVGPEAYRKTTGLGEVPGRAARLRQIARQLGKSRGLRDRLVLDPADVHGASPAAAFPRVTLDPGACVKDLELREVCLYEGRLNWATPPLQPGADAA